MNCDEVCNKVMVPLPAVENISRRRQEKKSSNNTTSNSSSSIPRYDTFRYRRWAKVVDVYDGDTFTAVMANAGFRRPMKYRVRCVGYDSPEMRPPKASHDRDDEIAAAKRAKQRLQELILHKTIELAVQGTDKYGRPLASFTVEPTAGVRRDICDVMVAEGFGYKYEGGTKKKFEQQQQQQPQPANKTRVYKVSGKKLDKALKKSAARPQCEP